MEKEEKKIKKNVRCRFNEQEYIGLQGCYQDVYHSLISKTQYHCDHGTQGNGQY